MNKINIFVFSIMMLLGGSLLAKDWTESLKIRGDFRYRHEMIDQEDKDTRNRHRIRARIDLIGTVNEETKVVVGISSGSTDPVSNNQTLTDAFVQNAVKDFKLWLEPVESVCERGGKVTVAEAMHIPEKSEYLKEDDSREKAMNCYVMGVHQPLIVRKGDEVTGILRFGDVFEIVREQLVNCALG